MARRTSSSRGSTWTLLLFVAMAIGSQSTSAWAQALAVTPPTPEVPLQATAASAMPSAPNRPPMVPKILPARFAQAELYAVVGKPLRLTLVAEDPDGQAVRIQAVGLPPTATFDEETATFTFTPTPALKGEYVVRFIASDGRAQSQRVLSLKVTENHPPQISLQAAKVAVDSNHVIELKHHSSDLDLDDLTFTVERLPQGAIFDARAGSIRWSPTVDDIGKHQLVATASDGSAQATASMGIEVVETVQTERSTNEWTSFLLPGVGYSAYLPRERDRFGTFHGVTLEILIGAWIHRNNNRGPSHGRVYVLTELLQSTRTNVPMLFGYALGFSLSLERNPRRRWLLPVYGLEVGGIISEATGGYFQTVPYAGLHVYSSPNVFVNLRGGYRLVPSAIERLGGAHFGATLDYSVW